VQKIHSLLGRNSLDLQAWCNFVSANRIIIIINNNSNAFAKHHRSRYIEVLVAAQTD